MQAKSLNVGMVDVSLGSLGLTRLPVGVLKEKYPSIVFRFFFIVRMFYELYKFCASPCGTMGWSGAGLPRYVDST